MFLANILKCLQDDVYIEIFINGRICEHGRADEFKNDGLLGRLLVEVNSINVSGDHIRFYC